MAGRVAGRREQANAGSDFRAVVDQLPVFPGRKHGGDALAGGSAALRQLLDPARIGPPIVFRAVDDQFGVRENGGVGALLHQPPDVIGMEMRDENRADLSAIDARGLHIGGQVGGVGLPLADARACVDHDELVADLQHHDGQRDRHEIGGQAGLGERRLGVLDRGVLDEGRDRGACARCRRRPR